MPDNPAELAALVLRLVAKAKPGPVKIAVEDDGDWLDAADGSRPIYFCHDGTRADADYLVAAWNTAPVLAREVERLGSELADRNSEIQFLLDNSKLALKAEIDRLRAENARVQKDVNDLNNVIRSHGYGQGQIDMWAVTLEENERLKAHISQLEPFVRERLDRAVADLDAGKGVPLKEVFSRDLESPNE